MGLKMAKFKLEADFKKSLFFFRLPVKTSSNKTFSVLKAGFLFLNFSSQIQYWNIRTADRTAKDEELWLGKIPKNQNLINSGTIMFRSLKCTCTNSVCQACTVGQLKNRCMKVSSGGSNLLPK